MFDDYDVIGFRLHRKGLMITM